MKPTYHIHQILYIKDIGYARVSEGPNSKAKGSKGNSKESSKSGPGESGSKAEGVNYDIVIGDEESVETTIFDPDMFNIEADSPFSDLQQEANLVELNTRKTSMEKVPAESERRNSLSSSKSNKQSSKAQNTPRSPAIVPMKLESPSPNVMVYCPETSLLKKITLYVRCILLNKRKEVRVEVEIVKTVDFLKNLIFQQLGEEIGHYSEIKIFSINPKLAELNAGSRTIWQYGLKHESKVTLMAKFNFTFCPILRESDQQFFSLSNTNCTVCTKPPKNQSAESQLGSASETTNEKINSQNVIKQLQQVVQNNMQIKLEQNLQLANTGAANKLIQEIAIGTEDLQSIIVQLDPKAQEKQEPSKNEPKESNKVQVQKTPQSQAQQFTPKKTEATQKTKVESPAKNSQGKENNHKKQLVRKIHLQCNSKFSSGFHYWQFKLDRVIPSNTKNPLSTMLLIGVTLNTVEKEQSSDKAQKVYTWGYNPITSRKIGIKEKTKNFNKVRNSSQVNGNPNAQQQSNQMTPKKSEENDWEDMDSSEDEVVFSDSEDEDYGMLCKTSDSIGVLLSIKRHMANLLFYRNGNCLQECYEIDVQKLLSEESGKSKSWYFHPFINGGGDFQVTLDSKASLPLDSYRYQ